MQLSSYTTFGVSESHTAFALGLDASSIITAVANVREARALPCGAIVGDLHGGLSFTDEVAAVLEARSTSGWREFLTTSGDMWTVIIVNT